MLEEGQVKTKTLYKALQVLDCFSATTPELGITEISERLGLYKSNVHNIMDT
ncbi:MAG: kdgR 1, partial [Paenibacillus sp.]|nr:kdgR 1 [Paenibacillus sp.]